MKIYSRFLTVFVFSFLTSNMLFSQMTLDAPPLAPNIVIKGEKEVKEKKHKKEVKTAAIDTQLVYRMSEMIAQNAQNIHFENNATQVFNSETSQKAFDSLVQTFEKYPNFKLIIRVKNDGGSAKNRVVALYNYVFKNFKIKAQQIDIQRFKPKDNDYIWCFENKEIAISLDLI